VSASFLLWGGLKGRCRSCSPPSRCWRRCTNAKLIYSLVFVAVAFSVLVQGTTIPFAAARLGIPMRLIEQTPWRISVPLRSAPESVLRIVVAESSAAIGVHIASWSWPAPGSA